MLKMLSFAIAVFLDTWIAAVQSVTSAFSRLTSRLIVYNENWNPFRLRRRLRQANENVARLSHAMRLGTRIVGCLSENEIHQHHMKMMGRTFIGGRLIPREEAMRGLATGVECEATRAEFKLEPAKPK